MYGRYGMEWYGIVCMHACMHASVYVCMYVSGQIIATSHDLTLKGT